MMRIGIIVRLHNVDQQVLGLKIANMDYLNAIVQWSEFDSIDLFYFDEEQAQVTQFWQSLSTSKTISLFPTREIARHLITKDYTLLLGLDPIYGNILISLRNQYSKNKCPVFYVIHTISEHPFREVVWETQQNAGPQDVILCSSKEGQDCVHYLMQFNQSQYHFKKNPFKGSTQVLPLGVSIPTSSAENLRAELGLAPDSVVFGCVSRLNVLTKMELSTLLIAFCELVSDTKRTDLQLLIAGRKENEAYYQKLVQTARLLGIADRVHFYLDFPRDQLSKIYQTLDVFVSLSDHVQETFGLTLLEALAHQVPVIASDWSGYRGIAKDCGKLISSYWSPSNNRPEKDPCFPHYHFGDMYDLYQYQVQTTAIDIPQCVDAMKAFLSKETRRQYAELGFQKAKQQFCWQQVIQGLQELVQKACRKKVGGHTFQNHYRKGFNIFSAFATYPSHCLQEQDVIAITDFGKTVLNATGIGFVEYIDMWEKILDQDRIWPQLVEALTTPTTIATVIKRFKAYEKETVLNNILFALKYHLIWRIQI